MVTTTNLARASKELFNRKPDERYGSLESLMAHCHQRRECSKEIWQPSEEVLIHPDLDLQVGNQLLRLNNWSFAQLCTMHRVCKRTINRVSRSTASQVLRETKPSLRKPLQLLVADEEVLSIHGTNYSRLYDAELLDVVFDAAPEFTPPNVGQGGATGLYSGERDLFAFMVDNNGWIEIDGNDGGEPEQFAPGFFVWNSEVGSRSVGIQSFWFQRVCSNHIVWDACDVFEMTRKHVGNVHEALDTIRAAIESLTERRDERKDGFAKAVKQAMQTNLGTDAEEVIKEAGKYGIGQKTVEAALEQIPPWQNLTAWSLVDGLTRVAGKMEFASDRVALDQKAAAILAAAA